MQSVTIYVRARGLESFTQLSVPKYDKIIRKHLPISESELVASSISLGYPDLERIAKHYARPGKRELKDILESHGMSKPSAMGLPKSGMNLAEVGGQAKKKPTTSLPSTQLEWASYCKTYGLYLNRTGCPLRYTQFATGASGPSPTCIHNPVQKLAKKLENSRRAREKERNQFSAAMIRNRIKQDTCCRRFKHVRNAEGAKGKKEPFQMNQTRVERVSALMITRADAQNAANKPEISRWAKGKKGLYYFDHDRHPNQTGYLLHYAEFTARTQLKRLLHKIKGAGADHLLQVFVTLYCKSAEDGESKVGKRKKGIRPDLGPDPESNGIPAELISSATRYQIQLRAISHWAS
ncbi:hypothetical protein B0H19DRAFT_1062562 [Mycena capillaripes]|nr:hypothetical protein B0H19DRAFT_1062562 [Mycena capillaripes]